MRSDTNNTLATVNVAQPASAQDSSHDLRLQNELQNHASHVNKMISILSRGMRLHCDGQLWRFARTHCSISALRACVPRRTAAVSVHPTSTGLRLSFMRHESVYLLFRACLTLPTSDKCTVLHMTVLLVHPAWRSRFGSDSTSDPKPRTW